MVAATLSPEVEILTRLIGPDNPSFTPEAARSILQLRFSDEDTQRMDELASKARAGSLTDAEETQLHGYMFVGAMVDLLHSKARISLSRSSGERHGE
jgi:hypothetical protein